MANTEKTKVLKIDTSQGQKSIKDLRMSLKEYQNAVLTAEVGTEEWCKAFDGLKDAKQTINDINDLTKVAGWEMSDVFAAATNSMAGLSAGIQTGSAALSLLGVESEDAAKAIQKMQSMMAITQGLSTMASAAKQMKLLWTWTKSTTVAVKAYNAAKTLSTRIVALFTQTERAETVAMNGSTVATGAATVATRALTAALISTGIGAIVVAVGMLAANWDKVTAAVKRFLGLNAGEELKKMKESWEMGLETRGTVQDSLDKLFDLDTAELKKRASKAKKDFLDYLTLEGKIPSRLLTSIKTFFDAYWKALQEGNEDAANAHLESIKSTIRSIGLSEDETKEIIEKVVSFIDSYVSAEAAVAKSETKDADAASKLRVELMKLAIAKEEVYNKDYKYTKEGLEAYRNYYAALKGLYAANTKEYKSAVNEYLAFEEDVRKREEKISDELVYAFPPGADAIERASSECWTALQAARKEYDKQVEQIRKEEGEDTERYHQRVRKLEAEYGQKRNDIVLKYFKEYYSEQGKISQDAIDKFKTDYNKSMQFREEWIKLYSGLGKTFEGKLDINKELTEKLNKDKAAIDTYYSNLILTLENKVNDFKSKIDSIEFKQLTPEGQLEFARMLADAEEELFEARVEWWSKEEGVIDSLNNATSDRIQIIEEQYAFIREQLSLIESTTYVFENLADGLGSVYTQIFENINSGFVMISKNLKEGKKGWSTWGQVATLATSTAANVLADMANQQDRSSKQGFEASKKYQIGAATMGTLTGILQASMMATNPEVIAAFSPYGAIALAATEAALVSALGAANIAKIANTKYGDDASNIASTASLAQIAAPVQYSAMIADTTEQTDNQDSRMWVSVSEIDEVQSRVRVNAAEARF